MRLSGLLLIAMGLWFIWQHGSQAPAVTDDHVQQPSRYLTLPDDPVPPAADEYAVILERPLFSPRRRPPVITKPEPRQVSPPRIRLSAITISNSVRVAVVRELDSHQTRHVREGDEVGEWVVEKVGRNSVILTVQEQRITIPLFGGD